MIIPSPCPLLCPKLKLGLASMTQHRYNNTNSIFTLIHVPYATLRLISAKQLKSMYQVQIVISMISNQHGKIKGILMQKEIEGHVHNIDFLRNQDKVLKESFSLFKGGTLDFLDEDLSGEVTDILSPEVTETATKKAYGDNVFKLSNNKGIHLEWEARISEDDIMRFASYNIDFSRMHKLPFTTVIVTTQKPSVTDYINPSMTFTPKIINLKNRDADKVLTEIEKKIQTGEHNNINALEIIYLPLYGSPSGKNTADLLDTVIKLAPKVAKDDKHKQNKIQDLLILLTGSFVSVEELNKILEENMLAPVRCLM